MGRMSAVSYGWAVQPALELRDRRRSRRRRPLPAHKRAARRLQVQFANRPTVITRESDARLLCGSWEADAEKQGPRLVQDVADPAVIHRSFRFFASFPPSCCRSHSDRCAGNNETDHDRSERTAAAGHRKGIDRHDPLRVQRPRSIDDGDACSGLVGGAAPVGFRVPPGERVPGTGNPFGSRDTDEPAMTTTSPMVPFPPFAS